LAFRKGVGKLVVPPIADTGRGWEGFRPKDPAETRRHDAGGESVVDGGIRHRDGNADETKRKVREVSRPVPDARPVGNSSSVRDGFGAESEYRRMGIPAGARKPSGDVGQSVLPEGGTGDGLLVRILEGVKFRIKAYPKALWEMLVFAFEVMKYFGIAVWDGKVYPLREGGTITDHGRVIGYLDGDKAQSAGRRLALPFIVLFAGARLLGLLSVIVYPVIIAQILVWAGVIAEPGGAFTSIFWVMAGVLGLSILMQIDTIFIHKRTIGLRDVISLLNLNRPEPKPDTTQRVYRDDDTLAVKVKRGVEEYSGEISKK